MGDAAEYIAERFGVSRTAMDEFALSSHRKAVAAIEDGKFTAEIVPVAIQGSRGEAVLVDRDEAPRRDTSLEALAKLPPAFKQGGRVTAGNVPGLNDAACALVLALRDRGRRRGIAALCLGGGEAVAVAVEAGEPGAGNG